MARPTDNDRIGGMSALWEAWGLDHLERKLISKEPIGGGGYMVRADTSPAQGYRPVRADIAADKRWGDTPRRIAEIPSELTDVARVGTVMETVPGLEEVEWFGHGPHETYPDRRRGGRVGRFHATVADLYTPYIRPQENGGRSGVREVTLTSGEGHGLHIVLDQPRQVSLLHYRATDLASATHDVDLVPRAETIIHLDAAHRGLGTASCGPDTLPDYMVGPGVYRWAWTLGPVTEVRE